MKLDVIRKRDGTVVPFDKEKITRAIFKAARAVGGEDRKRAEELTEKVIERLKNMEGNYPDVETVQDVVEKVLIEEGHAKTAKAYILYRDQHARIRQLNGILEEAEQLVDGYIERADWRVKENSNMTYSLQGLNVHISSRITERYWLSKIYTSRIREAHTKGDFHIHDLGLLSAYCCGWELRDLLAYGFKGVYGKIASNPPKHLRTALGQIVNFFYTLQGEAAGAQAFSNFDTYLAPFIRADNLSYEQVKQHMQEFLFNINVPTRVGFQTPFTNVTMDLVPSGAVARENVVIGGKLLNDTYADYQDEIDMLNNAFAEVMLEGDATGRVFTFPIPTYNITKDFDWNAETAEKVFEMTAKYGIPYFANFINSDMNPDDARSMCCRLRLDNRELRKRGGGLFASNPLTGSIGVVTLNMPRIGYLSKDDTQFLERVGELMDIAKESLEIKREAIEKFTERGLYPYSKHYLKFIKEGFGGYWSNHFSTIGLLGMNEALLNFMGTTIGSEEGRRFALRVMDYMLDKLREYQDETNHLYNLEATPGEGTTYRFARLDKEIYPDIITANEEAYKHGAAPYYTNSTQLPVNFTDDIFEALDLQDELQTKYTGGTVLHIFLGERLPDGESAKILVKRIAERYTLPYFTLTPTFSICPKHGYIPGEHEFCPICDAEIGYIQKEVA
ncbi:MAG: ribonucleoside triphosphate reductase [Candidatus Diapherotrites archaeon]|nr:ribonucleoside triphosphate reductase [Candidatus Diapherotrites archaeon]